MQKLSLLLIAVLLCAVQAKSQNGADNLYVNSLSAGFDYQATTFVVDSTRPTAQFPRGLLLWAANSNTNALTRQALSVDEIDSLGNPITERENIHANVLLRSLQPKTIIRSVFSKSYYLLAHVIGSPNPINGLRVNSSAIVFKIDDNLNLIWSAKIHFNPVLVANSKALIEYNELMELDDKNIALVGRYAETSDKQHALQITKLDGSNGSIIWSNWYYLWDCNSNGLSIEEATNNELVVTGYLEKCGDPLFSGFRQLLFGRVDQNGSPIQFRRFFLNRGEDVSGDKISRFLSFGPTVRDRYFITGFVRFRDPVLGAINQQNLVIDISQLGDINRAAQFGGAGVEEVSDHIFTQTNDPQRVVFELNLTGSTTSYGPQRAYIASLIYDVAGQAFSINKYDVIKNAYGSNTYNSRWGQEIKYAGPQRFAVLLNSSLTTPSPTYNHIVTHVFVRAYLPALPQPQDTTCYSPKMPPIDKMEFNFEEKDPRVEKSPYAIYPESWIATPRISKKLDCGPAWRILPRLAVRNILRRGLYRGPGDVVPLFLRVANPGSIKQLPLAGSGMLYPNPADNEVSLLIDESMLKRGTPITIGLYSPDMKLIRSNYANGKPLQRIALNGVLPGIYLIQVQQEGYQRTYRFIKK